MSKAHSEKLHKAYAGDKNIITFEGDHNSHRPQFFYTSVLFFLKTVLQVPSPEQDVAETAAAASGYAHLLVKSCMSPESHATKFNLS